MTGRRFPEPWSVHHGDGSYWVQDANGRKFGFVYFVDRDFIGSGAESRQTRDEARRLASNFARLPALLRLAKERKRDGEP